MIPLNRHRKQHMSRFFAHPLGALSVALLAALYGAVVQLLFKTASTALMHLAQTNMSPYPSGKAMAMQIGGALSCAFAQIGFLNTAIVSSPITYAVPAYQSALLLFTLVIAGSVL